MENYSDNLNISYVQSIKLRSQMIYIAVLLSTIIALATLPFITVHVSVRGSGIIQSAQTGNDVFSEQKLAELSPDTMLTAICYVKSADIGLIRKGQMVRLMVNAFSSNKRGGMDARVIDISDDVVVNTVGQSSVFKVKCRLLKPYLSLKNGYHGMIKRGMTLDAHFIVAKQTAYQLLYDKLDNWLNPGFKGHNEL